MGVAALPYHIVPATTKAAKNTAAILLESTVSMLPIRRALYKRSGGRTVRWNKPAIIPTIPAAIWWATIPPGLKGLKPAGPHSGATASICPVSP